MTRYAAQIIEMSNRGSNRKEQYYHLADIFMKCRDLNEAHCLSAYVFGVRIVFISITFDLAQRTTFIRESMTTSLVI